MSEYDWVAMTFDPEVVVDVRRIIRVMHGDLVVASADDWLDMKEQIADLLEQFLEMRCVRSD